MKRIIKIIVDFLLINILIVIFTQSSSVLIGMIGGNVTNQYLISILYIVFSSTFTIISIYIFFRCRYKQNIFNIKELQRKKFVNPKLLYVILGILALGIIIPLSIYALNGMKFKTFIWDKLYIEDIIMILIIGVVECVLEVAAEEMTFRYAVNKIANKYLSVKYSIIFSTIWYVFIISFDKGVTPIAIINLALFNFILSYVFFHYGSIWYCIIFRAVFEFIIAYIFSMNRFGKENMGIIVFDNTKYSLINGGSYGIYASIITTIIFVFICLFIVYKHFRCNIPKK